MNTSTIVTVIAAVIGAFIAVFTWLFAPPALAISKTAVRKLSTAAVLGVGVAIGAFFLLSEVFTNSGSASAGSSPTPTLSTTISSQSTPTPTPIPSPQPTEPLRFYRLSNGQSVGRHLQVTLTGTVPSGDHLWIFVYSAPLYYVQGEATPQPPDFWYLPGGATFGLNAAGDRRVPYTIYAVVANAQANKAIARDFHKTGGNTGTRAIPGDGGAHKGPLITVFRSH